jgi:Zn-dependent oligopeptidase
LRFLFEQVRKAKYDLTKVKPYFELTTVLEKESFAAKKMYGITFKQRKDLPVYHPDVVAYEVLIMTENQWHLLFRFLYDNKMEVLG